MDGGSIILQYLFFYSFIRLGNERKKINYDNYLFYYFLNSKNKIDRQ